MENKNKNNFRVVIISVTMMHWKKRETCCTMNSCLHNDVFDDLYIWLHLEQFFSAGFLLFEDGPVAEVDLFCPCCCNCNCSGSVSTKLSFN